MKVTVEGAMIKGSGSFHMLPGSRMEVRDGAHLLKGEVTFLDRRVVSGTADRRTRNAGLPGDPLRTRRLIGAGRRSTDTVSPLERRSGVQRRARGYGGGDLVRRHSNSAGHKVWGRRSGDKATHEERRMRDLRDSPRRRKHEAERRIEGGLVRTYGTSPDQRIRGLERRRAPAAAAMAGGIAIPAQGACPEATASVNQAERPVSGLPGFAMEADSLRANGGRVAPRSGFDWTDEESEDLLRLYQAGASVYALAHRHGRTELAINYKLASLQQTAPSSGHDVGPRVTIGGKVFQMRIHEVTK